MKTKLSAILGVLLLSSLMIVPAMAQGNAPDADGDFGFGRGFGKGHGQGFDHRFQMAEQLDLTDAQKDQMRDLRTKHQKEMIQRRADVKVARLELRELIRDAADRVTINSKVEQIGSMQTEIEKARVGHRLDARNLLTPEQREKFDDMPMMGHGMRGGCDGHGPRSPKAPRGHGGRFGSGR